MGITSSVQTREDLKSKDHPIARFPNTTNITYTTSLAVTPYKTAAAPTSIAAKAPWIFSTLLTAALFDGAGAALEVDSALAVDELDEEADEDELLEEPDLVDVDLALAVFVVVVAVPVVVAFAVALSVLVAEASVLVAEASVLVAEAVLPLLGVMDWTVLDDSTTN